MRMLPVKYMVISGEKERDGLMRKASTGSATVGELVVPDLRISQVDTIFKLFWEPT